MERSSKLNISPKLLKEVISFKDKVSSKRDNDVTVQIRDAYEMGDPDTVLDFYFSIVSSQSYGPKMEKFYISQCGFEKVSSKLDRGDFKTHKDVYGEYKFTYSPEYKSHSYNFVQIRPWQDIAGYVFEVYSDVEGFQRLNITKEDLKVVLEKYGQLAHGTKETNLNEKKELAIRGKIGDDCWKDMISFHKEDLFS